MMMATMIGEGDGDEGDGDWLERVMMKAMMVG